MHVTERRTLRLQKMFENHVCNWLITLISLRFWFSSCAIKTPYLLVYFPGNFDWLHRASGDPQHQQLTTHRLRW